MPLAPRPRRLASDSPFVIYDDAFLDVLGPHPTFETLVSPADAHEGPVYVRATNSLYYTSVPQTTNVPAFGDRETAIGRIDLTTNVVSIFRPHSNMGNGMTLDREGRLCVCEQGTLSTPARITRIDLESGATETIVDNWFGLPFNSPNDVVVKRDGTVWFTDPSYGHLQGFRNPPLIGDFVYRYDPRDGAIDVVVDSFKKPNGLAFSPDESTLYVNDSAAIEAPNTYDVNLPHHIKAFDVIDGTHLAGERLFAVVTPGFPDGLKCDAAGRVYSSSLTGVKVYDARGRLLGEILAGGVANFCFGGDANDTIYMMCDRVVYAARVQATGATVSRGDRNQRRLRRVRP